MLTGVLLLIITGLLWVTGAGVFRHAIAERLNVVFIAGFAALVCMICCLPVMAFLETPDFPWEAHLLVFVSLFISGGLAITALYILNKVRHYHEDAGLLHQVAHLAILGPFLMGIGIFHETLTPSRFVGILLIVAALILLGLKPREERNTSGRSGIRWAAKIIGIIACALSQCAFCMPSYLNGAEHVGSTFRTFYFCFGALVAVVLLVMRRPALLESRKCFLPSMLLAFILLLVCGFLVFNGLNRLADSASVAIAFPLIIGCSTAAAYVLRAVFLKAKTRPIQSAGFILAVTGLIAICL